MSSLSVPEGGTIFFFLFSCARVRHSSLSSEDSDEDEEEEFPFVVTIWEDYTKGG